MADKANVAKINDWLWVGNCYSCPEFQGDAVIHIFRTDTNDKQERACVHGLPHIRMNYRDGDYIDASNLKNLDAFIEKTVSKKPKTLVHCHAGICRSPTIAIYLLAMIDGTHPIDAQHLITKTIFEQRAGEVCNVFYAPLKQIIELWKQKYQTRK